MRYLHLQTDLFAYYQMDSSHLQRKHLSLSLTYADSCEKYEWFPH
jgi:hypothetical protein